MCNSNLILNTYFSEYLRTTYMKTHRQYIRGLLTQLLDSYNIVSELQDKPGDLTILRQELLRIKGIMQVIVSKVDPKDYPSIDIAGLSSRAELFLNDYYFEREIYIMEPLYGDDPGRLRHIRHKILEALNEKDLTDKINDVLEKM